MIAPFVNVRARPIPVGRALLWSPGANRPVRLACMKPSRDIARLLEIMAALRTPGTGCPWDLEQTFRTIAPYTLEEAYEVSDAIQRADGLAAKDLKGEKKSGLRVHGRTGEKCDVCGDTIAEVSFADSSLQYCPTCQTGGKKLADRRLSKLLK